MKPKEKVKPKDTKVPANTQPFYKEVVDYYIASLKKIYAGLLHLSQSLPLRLTLMILLPIVVLIYYPSRVEDYDIFYHLRFGEYFIKNMTFKLDHSIFSWTPADPEWRYGIWIGSTILYLAYSLFSFQGLYLIQWGILIGCAVLYLLYMRSLGDRPGDVFHIFCLLLFYCALNLTAIYIKPELFTTLFFTIAVFLYFTIKNTGKNLFYIYPLLSLLWVNTHGGYLMGLGFMTLAFIGEVVNYAIKRQNLSKPLLIHFFIALVLSYGAVIINPYGIDYHIGIIKSLITEEYMGVAKRVFAWIPLWGYLFPSGDIAYRFFTTSWIMVFMIVSFISLCVYAFVKKRYVDVALIIVSIILFQQGMKAARVTIFLLIFWLFAIGHVFTKSGLMEIRKSLNPILVLAFFVISVLVIRVSALTLEDRSWFGINYTTGAPVREVEFVKRHRLPAPIFNDYLIGGYLIWRLYPDYKVFIDPRYGPYWKEVGPDYFNLISNLSPDTFKSFADKYRFKTIIIHMRERNIIAMLLGMPEWRLLYFDKIACVFVHQSALKGVDESALQVDISPERFKDIRNPDMLMNMFYFYVSIGEPYARQIIDYYRHNTSNLHINKYLSLAYMEEVLKKFSMRR